MNHAIARVRANVWKLYAYWFFHNLIFAYVIERLFWAGRGISVQQVVYLEIIYAVTVVLLEVPTGALADRFSRKWMMVLSGVFTFGEFFILIHAYHFHTFALAILSAACSRALSSGTSNAILYDSLKMAGDEASFEKAAGRVAFFDRAAAAMAALAGSFIAARWSLLSTYKLSLISTILAFGAALLLREPQIRSESDGDSSRYWRHISEAYRFIRDRADVRSVVLRGIVIAATVVYVDEFWQIYLRDVRVAVAWFGLYSVANSLMASAAGLLAHRFKPNDTGGALFTRVLLLFGVLVLGAGLAHTVWGILPLLGAYFISGLAEPLVAGYLHHRAESEHRATVESFQSLALRFATIVIGLGFGWLATRFSIFTGYRFLGVLALACWAFLQGMTLFVPRYRQEA